MILQVFSAINLFGGTPAKILELGKRMVLPVAYYTYEECSVENKRFEFKKQFIESGRELHECHTKNIVRHVCRLMRIIKKDKVRIVHTYFSFGEVLGYLAKSIFPNVKWITSFVSPDDPGTVKKFILRKMYRKLDAVVYITEYVKSEKYSQFDLLEYVPGRIVYNGAILRKIETDVARKASLELLSVGGLSEWKNHIFLVDVLKILRKHDVNVRLSIIGDGAERLSIERRAKELDVADSLDIIGYSSNVGGYLAMCDIYLHPALTEGFGIAVAEAMHLAKPVIVADAGGLPELVEHGKSGFIASISDPEEWAQYIVAMYRDNEMLRSIGNNARIRAVQLFSVQKFVEDHERLYRELLK